MKDLTEKILELQQKSQDLEPNETQRTQLVNELNVYTSNFIDNLDDTPTYSGVKETRGIFAIKSEKKSFADILQLYDKEVATKGINPASGGHLGYIPGGGIYTSAIADYLADVTNEYAGMYYASPGAVAIENELIDWMKSIFGFPSTAIGNLTSGGVYSQFNCLNSCER